MSVVGFMVPHFMQAAVGSQNSDFATQWVRFVAGRSVADGTFPDLPAASAVLCRVRMGSIGFVSLRQPASPARPWVGFGKTMIDDSAQHRVAWRNAAPSPRFAGADAPRTIAI